METVRSKDNTLIAYERSGSGPPLVLVHGTTADHTRWRPVLPELERQFTVHAMDRRGRGQSGDNEHYSLEAEFEDVAAVIDAAGPETNVLGHSFGALCALEAGLRTANLRRLILYEPAFRTDVEMYPPGAQERYRRLLEEGDRETVLVTFFRELVKMSDQEIEALRADASWQARISAAHTIVREMADSDFVFDPERVRMLGAPTLLLQGGNSPPVLTRPTELLAASLPNCRLVVMPGQGHAAMNTAPELFLREVITFLSE